jgi:glycosyltransferase involved in cell wall biosynthesis
VAGDASVTVVIPTQNRPALLARAINTAVGQSLRPLEILVILDHPTEETRELLRGTSFPFVRLLDIRNGTGAPCARNFGVQHAQGAWVAFLDDDDEWLPNKLELQVEAAIRSRWKYPIVCSQIIVRTAVGDFTQPRRAPSPSESIVEYLFCRRTLAPGEAVLQTSNLLTSRALLEQVSFREEQRRWQETDWLLRASNVPGTGLEFISRPLSVWHTEDKERRTISGFPDWRYLFNWVRANQDLFTPCAYSGALLMPIAHIAVQARDRGAFRPLLSEALARGVLDKVQLASFLLLFLSVWLVPARLHYRLRVMLREVIRSRFLRFLG